MLRRLAVLLFYQKKMIVRKTKRSSLAWMLRNNSIRAL
jgi:hypothetical protein